ncbi:hypothetical protein [Lichenibacterium ramalinae]|uniref:hypothetical protein n=1 Tax=Lichenibacterium ramalinae TaxID=2316527 RepID=UPI001FE0FF6E|nr:hypothetical protein [Lichenibacterium ramalinae]
MFDKDAELLVVLDSLQDFCNDLAGAAARGHALDLPDLANPELPQLLVHRGAGLAPQLEASLATAGSVHDLVPHGVHRLASDRGRSEELEPFLQGREGLLPGLTLRHGPSERLVSTLP